MSPTPQKESPRESDRLFGRVAVDLGFLSAPELEDFLRRQRERTPWRSLGLILIESGRLDEVQVNRILEAQRMRLEAAASASGNDLFGRILIQTGLVSAADLKQVVADQEMFHHRGYRFRLGELLQNKGLLTPEALDRILSLQKKHLLFCPKCLIAYNFTFGQETRHQNCRRCGGPLMRPRFEA